MESLDSTTPESVDIPKKPHILVFAGGKNGVGKTCIVANVAAAMVMRGKRVCVFDADTGMSNINALLGLRPVCQLEQVLSGEKTIADVVADTTEGVSVLPAVHGILGVPLADQALQRLNAALADLESRYDYVLVDIPAILSDNVLQYIEQAQFAFLVVTAEPAALTDGFALLKALSARHYNRSLRVIVNQAADYPAATDTYRRFAAVTEKCLKLKVEYGGFVIRDDNLPKSVALQMSVVDLAANSPASRCLFALADNIIKHIGSDMTGPGLLEYWHEVLASAAVRPALAAIGEQRPTLHFDPIPVREHHAPGTDELGQRLISAIRNNPLDQSAFEQFAGEFVEAYCEQFGRFPRVFKQLFYRWLEVENYAEPRLIELVTTLEALHAMRYQKPMFSLAENAARLVAQMQDRPDDHRELVDQLCAAYRQAYHCDVFDAEQLMRERIQAEDFTEQRFEELLQRLRDGFQARFQRRYQSQHELLLSSTIDALNTMAIDEKNLQDEISMLMHGFRLLSSRREKLMTAIKTVQNTGQTGVSPSPLGDENLF